MFHFIMKIKKFYFSYIFQWYPIIDNCLINLVDSGSTEIYLLHLVLPNVLYAIIQLDYVMALVYDQFIKFC